MMPTTPKLSPMDPAIRRRLETERKSRTDAARAGFLALCSEVGATVVAEVTPPAPLCRCGHPPHAAQCPNPTGCWCDTFTD